MSGIGTAIKGLLNGGKIVEQVGNVIDNLSTSKEEKEQLKIELEKEINRHSEVVETELTKRIEIELKDNQDARAREIQVATSDKAPLINKIVTPVLAFIIIGLTFTMWCLIVFKQIPESNRDTANIIVGSLTTLSMGVVSYYFGSSAGSKAKQQTIEKQMK